MTEEAKHTPGPWVTDGSGEGIRVASVDTGSTICRLSNLKGRHGLGGRRDIDEVYANARLISAAPELLEALNIILAHQGIYGAVLNAWKEEDGGEEKAHAIFRQARAAIAKATT